MVAGAFGWFEPYMGAVSNAAHDTGNRPHGVASLPDDLSKEQLAAVPVLESGDSLVIEELTDAEADAFAAALDH